MKNAFTPIIVCFLMLVSGCNDATNSKGLSTIKAQKAFDLMKKGSNGTAKVIGVRAEPVMGMTIVDLTLTNFGYNSNQGNRPMQYSGPAEAVFTGYNDGRWTLKELSFPDPASSQFDRSRATFTEDITVE